MRGTAEAESKDRAPQPAGAWRGAWLRTLPEKPHEPFEVQWLRPLELVTSTPILFQPVNVQAVTSLMNPKLLIFRTP